ncbi:hypothetical protein [Enterococcus ureasiticus]|uniref:Transposase n=1 Tax=Enterococcus ureasiticus TaxID=903984 RepID=A0A1E5GH88_9ENTE|nr:hypothetical protein [Enterococcus ureasiticus]OEG11981.1 hypothetical protein BCR21_07020 [Enterococcus ureasiticus]
MIGIWIIFKNYTTNQVILPLDFNFQLEKNASAFATVQLVKEQLIEEEVIFIDGTKIEANANKKTLFGENRLITYAMYHKEQKKKFKQNPFLRRNR